MLNSILHHVGMSWIIRFNNEIKYEIDEIDHQDCLNKGPWYNTSICSRLHEITFKDFITNARTNRYNLKFSLVSNDKKLPAYEDNESSILDGLIPKHATTEALEALVDTLNSIDIWLNCLKIIMTLDVWHILLL